MFQSSRGLALARRLRVGPPSPAAAVPRLPRRAFLATGATASHATTSSSPSPSSSPSSSPSQQPPRLLKGLGATLLAFAGIYIILQGAPRLLAKPRADDDDDRGDAPAADAAATTTWPSSSSSSSTATTSPPTLEAVRACVDELRATFDESHLSTDDEVLLSHGYSSWSYHAPSRPAVVVYPETTEDCVRLVRVASKHRVPLVPYAGGTSLEAHWASPFEGRAVSVDFELMDRVLEVNAEDGDVVVQPGVRYEHLNHELRQRGLDLFFPVDPGPGAAIGGMLATGGSGTNAVRYGTMKGDYVLNVTVVLPSGEVIKTRSRARKSSAGPDLTKLFLGSEGTLGLIVEATLRLAPLQPTSVGVASFGSVEAAVGFAHRLLQRGVGVQCVELLDDVMVRAVNAAAAAASSSSSAGDARAMRHREAPTLFVRFAGTEAHRAEDERLIRQTAEEMGALPVDAGAGGGDDGGVGEAAGVVRFARDPEQIEALWSARKVALWSAMQYFTSLRREERRRGRRPGRADEADEAAAAADDDDDEPNVWTTDVCVPLGQLPELVRRVKADLAEHGVLGPIVGHVGDGNFHSIIVYPKRDADAFRNVEAVVERMVHHAQSLGGTATGEHGVGRGKRHHLAAELGEGTVELLRTLKRTLDPLNIMNPGALLPPEKT